MRRREVLTGLSSLISFSACNNSTPEEGDRPMDTAAEVIAPGTNRDFSFTVQTTAPDRVWSLWTDPSTWGAWDRGLKSATMDGAMRLGSTGQIVPLSGPTSTFEVVAFDPVQSYAFETNLPMAVLRVERAFNADRTAFTHHVTFSGPIGFAFAQMFGPGFRRALPPTMTTLNALAEGRG